MKINVLVLVGLLVGCKNNTTPNPPITNSLTEFKNEDTNKYFVSAHKTEVYNNGTNETAQYLSEKALEDSDTNTASFTFDTYYSKPKLFEIYNNGNLVVRILTNANVEFGEGIKPDEAAMQFWNMVSKLAKNQRLE